MGKAAPFPKWLWDLLPDVQPTPPRAKPPHPNAPDPDRAGPQPSAAGPEPGAFSPTPTGSSRIRRRELYVQLVAGMKQRFDVRIHRWRSSTTGCAWQVHYTDGTSARLIEAPYPRGPVSCAVFLHEIGHHAIGFHRYKPRCLEEFMAWRWAMDTMVEWGLNVTPGVERRVRLSLKYAVIKARRRGLKNVPQELLEYAA